MTRYVFPVVCANDQCRDIDAFGQRVMTTSDMLQGWSWTTDRMFSYDGREVALCPDCTLRYADCIQLTPAVSYSGQRR